MGDGFGEITDAVIASASSVALLGSASINPAGSFISSSGLGIPREAFGYINVTSEMLHVPVLWPSARTPSEEAEPIKDLYAHLIGLTYSVQAWDAALQLYRTSQSPPPQISRAIADRWRWIACHECVLELYHLRARLEKIQSVRLRSCPSLRATINMSKIKSARKQLDEYFPDIEALRHATAHTGENEAHPEVHAPDGRYALTGFREPDRFSTPYHGKLRYLDVTDQSLQRIIEVVTEFLSAFEIAAAELEKQGHIE